MFSTVNMMKDSHLCEWNIGRISSECTSPQMATWKYLLSVCTVFQRNGEKTHPGKEASNLKIHQQSLRGCGKLQVNGSPGGKETSLLLKSLTIQKWKGILKINFF
mmetsp:Transcript_26734/g.43451  ORF Transcript_26734/g.43451 Transcript_26734/m.43451 type:complete len:105 (-) Transcript_26734:134-448(-)